MPFTCLYVTHMGMIQIRNVPESLHRKLKARAAMAGRSLSDILLEEIAAFAERPTMEELRQRLAKLHPVTLPESPADTIRAMRGERDSR